MNREEAKYILRAFRVGGQDAHDPLFREALELLKLDQELAEWYAQELALDTRLANKIHAFRVPPDLKTQLLAVRKIVRPVAWWRKPAWMAAAAAAVVLLASLASLWLVSKHNHATLVEFREAMVQASLKSDHHVEAMDLDPQQVQQWLAGRGGNPDFILPAGLRDRSRLGCRVLEWRGQKVSLLCFRLDDDKHVDVFVISESDLSRALRSTPEFAPQGEVMTAAWLRDGKVYLMAGRVAKTELERLL